MDPYPVPAKETRTEMRVKNSRFIATIAPAFTVDEAKAFVSRIRDEFAEATHNVPAYVVGHGAAVTAHCNDDGEPAGTAGRPVLAVLQGSGLGDAAIVVTRYFGGTKLGTGGLVRAYGDAARAIVEQTPRALKTLAHTVVMNVPYPLFEQVRLLVAAHQGQILDETFAADVTVTARFAVDALPAFDDALQELSNGRLQAEVVVANEDVLLEQDN